ncbi:MAG: hypothetical protein U9Q08_01155 [Candidatus Omnitrophota bacterium]|nr:hypothetical protein [Candidatus Omnitrophota bacterium]
MRKALAFILVLIFLTGCATPVQKKVSLTIKDKNLLNQWMKIADLSYRISDFRLSCEYYQRIIKRYPDSESAQAARNKIRILQKILKTSGETDF